MEVEGFNFDIELEALGPAKPGEVKSLIAEIQGEGGHYVSVPPLPGDWPVHTMGRTYFQQYEPIEHDEGCQGDS